MTEKLPIELFLLIEVTQIHFNVSEMKFDTRKTQCLSSATALEGD